MSQFDKKSWNYQCDPFRIAPHIYYVGNRDVGSYLLDTSAGLVLIDQGYAENVYQIFESIRMLGFDPHDIRALLVSHGHIDHCGGTQIIQSYTHAPVWFSREDMEMYRQDVRFVHLDYGNWIDFQPDHFYDYDKPLQFGDLSVEVVHTPGHTPGTCSFFMTDTDKDGKAYRVGLYGGIGLNTQYDEFLAQFPAWPTSLLDDFIASIRKCQSRQVDITLPSHPNHTTPPVLEVPGDPMDFTRFVNPEIWQNMLKKRLNMALEMKEKRA